MRALRACWFEGRENHYARLARVLEFSARRWLPGWDIRVERLQGGMLGSAPANSRKLEWWVEQLFAVPDDSEVLLIDADCAILAPLDEVWSRSFDVAITERGREAHPFPLNAGVVFARATVTGRAFVEAWRQEDRAMLDDPARRSRWRVRFGGQNQAALGRLLTEGLDARLQARVLRLPCAEWNCEDSSWRSFGPDTRILHAKSALRRCALGLLSVPALRRPTRAWRALEREATA